MSTTKPASQKAKFAVLSLVLLGLGAFFVFSIVSQLETSPAGQTDAAQAALNTGNLEGQPAPPFALKNLAGETVKLEDYRGKVVFVNFWATWCDPCTEELPSMQRLRDHLKDQPFEILAISLDTAPQQAVPAFLAKTQLQLSFPILHDVDQKLSKTAYKTTGVPESFIIGADGQVVKHVIGSYEWDSEAIIEYFEGLLKDVAVS